jgi:hypothetical protein
VGILSSPVRKSVTRRISGLLAGDTLAARDGLEGLYLFAVLFDQMSNVDHALEAGVGALVLVVGCCVEGIAGGPGPSGPGLC